jgi:dynein heavy chain
MITDGLLRTIAVSLGYLLDETDNKKNVAPLFDAKLELCEPDIIFQPSLDVNMVVNFYDIMVGLVDDLFHMATLVPRVAKGQLTNDYLDVVSNHSELKTLRQDLIARVNLVIEQANSQKNTYLEYSYLWTESRQDYLYFFLNYSRQLTQDEVDQIEEDEKAIKKQYPTLQQFKEQIDHYEAIHDEVKQIDNLKIFQCWFRADISPFKTSLMNCVKRWSYAFKKHLLEHVTESLSELNSFIDEADEGLMTQVHEGDYEGLIKVMEFLQLVKERQSTTDTMFEPLKEIIDLLRSYGVVIPEESLVQLQELPEKWANTKRLSVSAKQQVAPLQGMEIGKLKLRIEDYETIANHLMNTCLQLISKLKNLKMRSGNFSLRLNYLKLMYQTSHSQNNAEKRTECLNSCGITYS